MSKATRPPDTPYPFTSSPPAPSSGCRYGRGLGDADGGFGFPEDGAADGDGTGAEVEGDADPGGGAGEDGGSVWCVEEGNGTAVSGTASGGS
ncbi:hypothetical protein [Streptomyces sp. NPDC048272]|uniref:hypothetical protein n=1 Tax=Streptomyces sp. NPDC048272 TaxID=3154616 RepID=UPI00342DDDDC